MLKPTRFQSLAEFYPYYLSEHSDSRCRALHYVGSTLVIALLIFSLATSHYMTLWFLPVIGYGFAWVGHFFIERNKPATFQYPVYSFLCDWIMLKDFLSGRFRKGFPGYENQSVEVDQRPRAPKSGHHSGVEKRKSNAAS